MNLTEFLEQHPPKPFQRTPVYIPAGDYLVYFLKDVPHVSEWLDDVITLYLDHDTRELVGCKVKGVRHILDTAGAFGVGVKDDGAVRLGFFFFTGAAPSRADQLPKMKWYDRLREWKDVPVQLDKLMHT